MLVQNDYVLDYISKKIVCVHNQSSSDNKANQYFYISPVNLSVDVLQHALATDNISYNEKTGYLGFVNQPSIVINKSQQYKDVRAQRNIFNLVVEKPEHKLLERIEYNAMLQGKNKSNKNSDNNNSNNSNMSGNSVFRSEITIHNKPELGKVISTRDISYLADIRQSLITKVFSCDLKLRDYVIIETFRNPLESGKEYTIVGYPSLEMNQSLELWPFFNEIHEQNSASNMRDFAELYNMTCKKADDMIKLDSQGKLESEINKLASSNLKFFFNYNLKMYKSLLEAGKITKDEYDGFLAAFAKTTTEHYNDVGKRYLSAPNTKIEYVFFVFDNADNYPFIYNIRQLRNQHRPILERIKSIIEKELLVKLNIMQPSRDRDRDREYKLFYSYYKLGDIFHIKTKYFHMMSNMVDFQHNYMDYITLNELIYTIGNDMQYWENATFEYNLSDYHIQYPAGYRNSHLKHRPSKKVFRKTSFRNTIQRKTTLKNEKKSKKNNDNSICSSKGFDMTVLLASRIVFCYEKIINKYVFIYRNDKEQGKFYYMELESCIDEFPEKIIKLIKGRQSRAGAGAGDGAITREDLIKCSNGSYDFIIQQQRGEVIPIYKICKHGQLTKDIYYDLSYNSPTIMKKFNPYTYYFSSSNDIPLDIYLTSLSPVGLNTMIQPKISSLYSDIPILIKNYLDARDTISGRLCDAIPAQDKLIVDASTQEFKSCAVEPCVPVINCIHINPVGCDYDILEIIQIEKSKSKQYEKKLLYIVPSIKVQIEPESADFNPKYIGNFQGLNASHIPLLEFIKSKYLDDDHYCFVHTSSIFPIFFCLHFHVIPRNIYKTIYPATEKGTSRLVELHINRIINNLVICGNYYNQFDIEILRA